MTARFVRGCVSFALAMSLVATASAQQDTGGPVQGPTVLGVSWTGALEESGQVKLAVNLDDATGPAWMLMVSLDGFQTLPALIGPMALPADGQGYVSGFLPPELEQAGLTFSIKALWSEKGKVRSTETSWLSMEPTPGCSLLEADWGWGGVPLLAGELVTEQWAPMGLHVSCTSQLPASQPNKCIIFDSSNPTGGDFDLATPGYGAGNTVAEGMLFIIAEDDVDADHDGYVDDPDDAYNGGVIHFTFDTPKTICSVRMVDVDDSEPGTGITKLRFYKDAAGTQMITAITVEPHGDCSCQTMYFHVEGVRRFDIKAGGSMGLVGFGFCPSCIDFDTTTTGLPVDLKVGEEVTTQFVADLGVTFSADNHTPGHPDKCIVFDSASPTGGDIDLVTPGYGFGNLLPEGKVLVIAENDVDANMDGLVDVPDDEAYGGNIFLDFDYDVAAVMVTVLDVDTGGTHFIQGISKDNVVVGVANFAFLGDNSRQSAMLDVGGIRRLKVHFGGSAAIVRVCFCPEP